MGVISNVVYELPGGIKVRISSIGSSLGSKVKISAFKIVSITKNVVSKVNNGTKVVPIVKECRGVFGGLIRRDFSRFAKNSSVLALTGLIVGGSATLGMTKGYTGIYQSVQKLVRIDTLYKIKKKVIKRKRA